MSFFESENPEQREEDDLKEIIRILRQILAELQK